MSVLCDQAQQYPVSKHLSALMVASHLHDQIEPDPAIKFIVPAAVAGSLPIFTPAPIDPPGKIRHIAVQYAYFMFSKRIDDGSVTALVVYVLG